VELASVSARSWWGLAYLIVFVAYVNPLIAVLLGSLLANEPLTARIMISALVIVSSVAIINTARSPSPKAQPEKPLTTPAGDD
jgi:drug/metabolite transporter (DMT)-like permease